MKTTLEIPDDLFRAAKAKAALDGIKLKELVADGLRLRLAVKKGKQPGSAKPRRLVKDLNALPVIKGTRSRKLKITPQRIHQLEMEAELKHHAASVR